MSERWEYGDVAEAPADPGFPWPPAGGESAIGAFGQTWKSATLDPGPFYRRVPRDGGTGVAVLYYLIIGVLVAGANLFWNSLSLAAGRPGDGGLAAELGIQAIHPVVGFLLTPAALLFMLGLSAAVVHMILSLFDGTRHGFGTTVRVFCYAYSPGLLGVIPWIGGLIGSVWMLVLLIIGLREAHETDGWKTAVAVLLPFVLLLGLMIFSVLLMFAAGAALLGSGVGAG
jgi:hypothetical protein